MVDEHTTKKSEGIGYIVTVIFVFAIIQGVYGCGSNNESSNTNSTAGENIEAIRAETQNERQIRFQKDIESGVITDATTSHQWLVGPDSDVKFFSAREWVDGLGDNWRLPIRAELRELREAGIGSNNWGLFRNSGTRVWSGELDSDIGLFAFYIKFNTSDHSSSANTNNYREFRVFAIRSSGSARFIADSEGIIIDRVTNLQWFVGPDEDTNWYAAQDWIDGLGNQWRMPSRAELEALYDAGIITTNWGLFENSGHFVWTSDLWEEPGTFGNRTKVICFDFSDYSGMRVTRDGAGYTMRGFAVRSNCSRAPVINSVTSSSTSTITLENRQSFDSVNTIRPDIVSSLGNSARTRILQDSDLAQLSYREIKLVRNYFYACYDRPFATTWIRDFFSLNMSGYRGNGVSNPVLTDTENSNITMIQEYERVNNIPIIDY